jgi:coatomer subunit beta'
MTKMNVAYMCYFLTNNPQKCLDVLIKSKRFSEAALFARTYCSDRISECVKLWKNSLMDKTIAEKIGDPSQEEEEDEEEGEEGDEGEEGAEEEVEA